MFIDWRGSLALEQRTGLETLNDSDGLRLLSYVTTLKQQFPSFLNARLTKRIVLRGELSPKDPSRSREQYDTIAKARQDMR
jgi:hypothetical protein